MQNTSYHFQIQIKPDLRKDDQVEEYIIDIAEAASKLQDGTLYIQCLTKHKEAVLERLKVHIAQHVTTHPEDNIPEIVLPSSKTTSNNSASAT